MLALVDGACCMADMADLPFQLCISNSGSYYRYLS